VPLPPPPPPCPPPFPYTTLFRSSSLELLTTPQPSANKAARIHGAPSRKGQAKSLMQVQVSGLILASSVRRLMLSYVYVSVQPEEIGRATCELQSRFGLVCRLLLE